MAYWHCTACTATYSVGAAQCPQCGSKKYSDEPVEAADVETADDEPKKARKS